MLPREEGDRVDGRKLRAQKTRKAIVLALLDLLEEGKPEPTAREIAERADVAIRSIRQHFESREELLLAVAEEHAERLALSRTTIDTASPLATRIGAFVAARAKELEASASIRLAASRATESEVVTRAVRATARARKREASTVFATELETITPNERRAFLDALDAATAGRTWDGMRKDAGLTVGQARAAMQTLLESLLKAGT
jgi:AcrR family transcriptional regulator